MDKKTFSKHFLYFAIIIFGISLSYKTHAIENTDLNVMGHYYSTITISEGGKKLVIHGSENTKSPQGLQTCQAFFKKVYESLRSYEKSTDQKGFFTFNINHWLDTYSPFSRYNNCDISVWISEKYPELTFQVKKSDIFLGGNEHIPLTTIDTQSYEIARSIIDNQNGIINFFISEYANWTGSKKQINYIIIKKEE